MGPSGWTETLRMSNCGVWSSSSSSVSNSKGVLSSGSWTRMSVADESRAERSGEELRDESEDLRMSGSEGRNGAAMVGQRRLITRFGQPSLFLSLFLPPRRPTMSASKGKEKLYEVGKSRRDPNSSYRCITAARPQRCY